MRLLIARTNDRTIKEQTVNLRPPARAAILALAVGLAGCGTGSVPVGPKVVSTMPANGALQPNEVVLVNDGSCPAGQIKQVVGGSNRIYETDIAHPGTSRTVSCIARP